MRDDYRRPDQGLVASAIEGGVFPACFDPGTDG